MSDKPVCQHPGCNVRPRKLKCAVANITGAAAAASITPIYCSKHRVISTPSRCYSENCDTQPRFGAPGKCSISCKLHALNGMIINPNKKCELCSIPGIWGKTATGIRRCEEHKLTNDKNFIKGISAPKVSITPPVTHIVIPARPPIVLVARPPIIIKNDTYIPSFGQKITAFLGGMMAFSG